MELGNKFRLSGHKARTNGDHHEIDPDFLHSGNGVAHPEWNETGVVSTAHASLGNSCKAAPGYATNVPGANWNVVLLPGITLFRVSQPLNLQAADGALSTDLNTDKLGPYLLCTNL